jgi:hypothetical protein
MSVRASRGRGVVVVVVGLLLAFGGGLVGRSPALARRNPERPGPPPPQQQQGQDLYGCDRTFGQPPVGHLVKHTNPAGGATVRPGDSVVVVLSWPRGDWSSDRLHKVLDCVAVDGELDPSLQGGESPTANDGQFSTAFTVPADLPDGAQICDQAMLSGPSPRGDYDRQISNQVCHTVSRGGASCTGSGSCGRGCGDHSSCGERPPCERCSAPPPCSGGCAERRPCDRDCGSEACDARCDQDRRDQDRGDQDRRDEDRRGKDCRCHRDREGLVRRLIHELL